MSKITYTDNIELSSVSLYPQAAYNDQERMLLEIANKMIKYILTPAEKRLYEMSKSMKPRAIALALGKSAHTVRVSLYRINQKIKKLLEEIRS